MKLAVIVPIALVIAGATAVAFAAAPQPVQIGKGIGRANTGLRCASGFTHGLLIDFSYQCRGPKAACGDNFVPRNPRLDGGVVVYDCVESKVAH